MKIRIFVIFIFIFYSSSVFSTNIRVIDFQKIIENNKNLTSLYDQINLDQEIHKEEFKKEEINLKNEIERIEKLRLILEPQEIDNEIENYNKKLNNLNTKIQKFNSHYEKQIDTLKSKIINIILEVLKKYSEENKIELILDSSSYILSSNSINITNIIEDLVSKKNIETNFEKY